MASQNPSTPSLGAANDAREPGVVLHAHVGRQPDVDREAEFSELVAAAGAEVAATLSASRDRADPRYFVGRGKVDEAAQAVERVGASLLFIDADLTPSQERNIERAVKCRVVDRTGVILDIFAQRAATHEGKLQVELAQLRHLSTRLVRGWSHLERQKGGIGLRGPGESQLETDRRLIGDRIKVLKERLNRVRARRHLNQRARQRGGLANVALVGYTNAGKSTLFNALTGAGVLAVDQLFATLDPTARRVELPDGGDFVLSDTVGFIRALPHELVAAFQATLEQVRDADLLLLVVDAADEDFRERLAEVHDVLAAIGAASVPTIEVFNKCDMRPELVGPDNRSDEDPRVYISAATGAGVAELQRHITDALGMDQVRCKLRLPVNALGAQAELRARALVRSCAYQDDGSLLMDVAISPALLAQLRKRFPVEVELPGGIKQDREPEASAPSGRSGPATHVLP